MDTKIKILLASDIHLGLDDQKLKIPNNARINTFKKIIALAKEHDVFLLAGDLIDNAAVDAQTVDLIKSELRYLRDNNTEVLYTPGIGELNKNGMVSSIVFDFNPTYVFFNKEISHPYVYEKGKQKVYVYGIPASNNGDISRIKKSVPDGFHLGLFHVNFNSSDENDSSRQNIYSLQKEDIKGLELDFYALGHNHNFKMFKVFDRILGAYPGSPEATSFDETGDRYVISIIIENNEIFQIKRLTVNSFKVNQHTFDCTNQKGLEPIIKELQNVKSQKFIQRLVLTGERNFELGNELDALKKDFYNFELIDKSFFAVDYLLKEYTQENSIRGEFYRILKEKIDQNEIPKNIEMKDLSLSLNILTKKGFESLEEWLCNLSNA